MQEHLDVLFGGLLIWHDGFRNVFGTILRCRRQRQVQAAKLSQLSEMDEFVTILDGVVNPRILRLINERRHICRCFSVLGTEVLQVLQDVLALVAECLNGSTKRDRVELCQRVQKTFCLSEKTLDVCDNHVISKLHNKSLFGGHPTMLIGVRFEIRGEIGQHCGQIVASE